MSGVMRGFQEGILSDVSEDEHSLEPFIFESIPVNIDVAPLEESDQHLLQHNLILDHDVEKTNDASRDNERNQTQQLSQSFRTMLKIYFHQRSLLRSLRGNDLWRK